MGERNFELGPGMIYLDGMTYLGNIDGGLINVDELGITIEEMDELVTTIGNVVEVTAESIIENALRWVNCTTSEEATFTGYLKLGRGNGKSELAVWHMLMGIEKRIIELCPNKRVVHLAYHAKKRRARKKNYNRMCRIVEKLGGIK